MKALQARFTAAVFDMDGLLLDSERAVRDAWLQASREFGVPLDPLQYLEVVGCSIPSGRSAMRG